jgi:long-subunit fatty acid transport protein
VVTLIALLLVAGFAPDLMAQGAGVLGGDRAIPPTPVPVGSGARAAGMSNAFVAIADDATAASWNPAGLVQLERPEFSIVGSLFRLHDRFSATGNPAFGGDNRDDTFDLNFLSVAAPLPFTIMNRNATVSLSYQRKFDFNRSFDASLASGSLAPFTPPLAIGQFSRLQFDQQGGLSAVSTAFAMELTRELSIGVAFNFWRSTFLSDNEWSQHTRTRGLTVIGPSAFLSGGISREEYNDFRGENFTVGLLWKTNPRWSLGLRYDSAFTARANYTSFDMEIRINPLVAGLNPGFSLDRRTERRRIRIPDTWALGVAYRANDRFTVAMDVSRTDWNDFLVRDSRGRKSSLVDGADLSDRRRRTDIDPAYTVRLGAEYVFIPREPGIDLPRLWTLRGGLTYEEEPASNRSTRSTRDYFRRGEGSPDRFYGASLGIGLLLGQRVNIDLAYQLRYGPGVNRDLDPGASGFDDDELRHRVFLSTVIYF